MTGSPDAGIITVRPSEQGGIEPLSQLEYLLAPSLKDVPAARERVARYRDNFALVLDRDGPAVVRTLGERRAVPAEVAQVVYRVMYTEHSTRRPVRDPWLVLCDDAGEPVWSLPPFGLGASDLERFASAAGWDIDLAGTQLDGWAGPGSWEATFPHWSSKPRLYESGEWRESRWGKLKQRFGGPGNASPKR